MTIFFYLSLNVFLAVLWMLINQSATIPSFAVGFGVGYVALTIAEPGYGRRIFRALFFAFYVVYQIIKSTLIVVLAVLQPHNRVKPGIVAIPLDATGNVEIMLLATVITLTPGTISVETGRRADGKQVLFVHCLQLDDPSAMADGIKHDFERRIIGFTRPVGKSV
jgi:multicomponent Na+:H+ antiporter subunit E